MDPDCDQHRKAKRDQEEVRFTDDGFELLRGGKSQFQVTWADVRGIAAWKQDCFIGDLVFLGFRTDSAWEYLAVSEEAGGYKELVLQVSERYPDLSPVWLEQVSFPPLQYCWTPIWGDAPETTACVKCGYNLTGTTSYVCPECGYFNDPEMCRACDGRGHQEGQAVFWIGVAFLACAVIAFLIGPKALRSAAAFGLLIVGIGFVAFGYDDFRHAPCKECSGSGKRIPPEQRRAVLMKRASK